MELAMAFQTSKANQAIVQRRPVPQDLRQSAGEVPGPPVEKALR
jgi:hypothetical protein